jgi:hypothetical protein
VKQLGYPVGTRGVFGGHEADVSLQNPVSSAKSPAKLVFEPRSAGTADLEITPRGQPSSMERRPSWSPFRGVMTAPSDNTASGLSLINLPRWDLLSSTVTRSGRSITG